MKWPTYKQIGAFWFWLAVCLIRVGSLIAAMSLLGWLALDATPPQVDRAAALLTPVVAVLGAYIAFQQWRTARNKLKLELFDRRYVVYAATQKLINEVSQLGEASANAQHEFLTHTRGASWLFDRRVAAYVDEVERRMREIDSLYDYIEVEGPMYDDPHTAKLVAERDDHRYWFAEKIKEAEGVFGPYMAIDS